MKKFFMCKLWLLAFTFLTVSAVWADDESIKIKEVVISASKIEEPAEETTSRVIIIPNKTIESKGAQFIGDVLKDVPEINLIQSGGQGKLADVILRGGSSSQVLVMIDGVKVKSTTTGTFDFSGITADDIEKIEIVKGPQSTIYGSEAMAGVINIITKKGRDKTHADLALEGGSFDTYKTSASFSGALASRRGSEMLNYRFTASYFSTEGISISKRGDEKDGYKNASFSTKLGIKPSDIFNLEFTGRYYYDRSELDDYNYTLRQTADALNFVQNGHHYVISGKGRLYLFDTWEQILTVSNIKDSLKTRDTDTSWNNYDIITGMETVDWQNNLYLSGSYTLTAGFENRLEKGENIGNFSRKIYNNAVYFNNKLSLFEGWLHVDAGIRYDVHETFGNKYTYRIGSVYDIKPADLRILANYGTGFRAPTFNELFYPNYGNPNLTPEESWAWEVGLEKGLLDNKLSLSITYFDQNYDNLIQTDPFTWTAVNIGKAQVKGIETGISAKPVERLTVRTVYTYMDTEDKDTGQRLVRRPKDKLNITAEYSAGDLTLLAGYTFVGEVFDTIAQRNLESYSLINISGDYKLTKNIKLFGRIDNLLDEDYETAGGYNSPGFSAFTGVKFEI
ncbi:MAG: TonB-dependent receptor [Nitrospirota bacterium]